MASTVGLEFVLTAVDKASKTFGDVGDAANQAGGKFGAGISKATPYAVGALGALGAGLAMSVSAAQEADAQHLKLEDAYRRFPALADTNIAAMDKLNASIQRKTGADDDDLAAGQAVLAQYGLTGQQIQELTPLVNDFAVKTGTDLTTAFGQVGKSMLGQGKALKGVGIDFKDAGDLGGNYQQVLDGLTDKVGGYAETVGGTAAGKSKIFNQQLSNLKESIGEQVMPALSAMMDKFVMFASWASQNSGLIMGIAVAIGAVAAAVVVINGAMKVFAAVQAVQTAVQWANNAAWLASPITWIILAVIAAIAAVVLAIQNWGAITEWLKGVWAAVGDWFSGLWDGLKSGANAVWNVLKTVWNWSPYGLIINNWGTILDFFKQVPGMLGDALKTVANVLTWPFRTAFNKIADLWNDSVGQFSFTVPDWVPGVGGKGFSLPKMPHIPGFADGVQGFSGGWAMVGERGPELAYLPKGSDVYPTGTGPGNTYVNVYEAVSAEATAMQVTRRLARLGS